MSTSAREQRETEAFELQREAKIRRTVPLTQLVLILLLLAFGITYVIDQRRLNSPGGTALSWAQAATFGVCNRYLDLSVPPPGTSEPRSDRQVCSELRARTQRNREEQTLIIVRLVASSEGEATVTLERRQQLGDPLETARAEINLVQRDGRWRVVLDGDACNPLGCA